MDDYDGTELAQKALSCVYRTGQRFGLKHIVDVLRGSDNEKVLRFGHQSLSTFGIGSDLSDKEWNAILRQLVIAGFLKIDYQNFGAALLSDKSMPVLKGKETLRLRKLRIKAKAEKKSKKKAAVENVPAEKMELYNRLRTLRAELAKKSKVPAFYVFHDSSLKSMVQLMPKNLDDFTEVNGVGQAKLKKYGQQFLDEILNFNSVN